VQGRYIISRREQLTQVEPIPPCDMTSHTTREFPQQFTETEGDFYKSPWIVTVTHIIATFANSHEIHINIEVSRFLNVNNITRRLKRKKPFELVRR
jgi:hypothetical protein